MSSQAELIIDARNGAGESPVWHVVEQALYWTDIPARKLWRWTVATATAQSWDTPELLAWMEPGQDAGGWITGMETGVLVLKPQAGEKADAQRVATVVPGLIHRFTPRGKLDRSLAVPVKKPAMCAFGGAGLGTLFVTSIRPGGGTDLSDQPLAGGLFALHPGVRGLVDTACLHQEVSNHQP